MLGIAGVMPEVLYASVKVSISRGSSPILNVLANNHVYIYIVHSI